MAFRSKNLINSTGSPDSRASISALIRACLPRSIASFSQCSGWSLKNTLPSCTGLRGISLSPPRCQIHRSSSSLCNRFQTLCTEQSPKLFSAGEVAEIAAHSSHRRHRNSHLHMSCLARFCFLPKSLQSSFLVACFWAIKNCTSLIPFPWACLHDHV